MFRKNQVGALAQYEERAFALYFVNDIRYPYVSVTLMSLVSAWLMHGKVSNAVIAAWLLVGMSSNALREGFVRYMKPQLERGRFENLNLISDLEQRNAEVESASRNKSLFLAGVSHDLRQPIRAIGMYTGFLRHSAPRDGAPNVVTQTAEKIETAVSAIHGQISRLLELSRLESGAMPLNLEALDLDDVFTPVHLLLAPQAKAQATYLGCDIDVRSQPGCGSTFTLCGLYAVPAGDTVPVA